MKHIVLFSGGGASSYAAWVVAQKHKDVILLHTPTLSEHPDADRFRIQVANFIGLPITIAGDGRDIWQLIDDENCLPSQFIPFCTRILKQEPADRFYKTLGDDFTLYLGYGADEPGRIQKQSARFEALKYKARYPLAERGMTGEDAKTIIRSEWKICLPDPYRYLKHNNCIPCFKGGVGHFYLVWKHYPEYFARAAAKEKQIGHTVFKEKSLEECAKEWEAERGQVSFLESDYGVPCMCAI
jgi:hypothetical protein